MEQGPELALLPSGNGMLLKVKLGRQSDETMWALVEHTEDLGFGFETTGAREWLEQSCP